MPASNVDSNHKETIRKQSPNLIIMPIERDQSETQEGGITEEENDSYTRDIS